LKVFFDEDVPNKLVPFLPGHDIHTVVSMKWGGIKNGALLDLIDQADFEVFSDRRQEHAEPATTRGPLFCRADHVGNQLGVASRNGI
jgi:hypothetical protein